MEPTEPQTSDLKYGWVYFIRYEDRIKIGSAFNPRNRFSAIQSGCPVPLTLLGVMRGGRAIERQLQKRFTSASPGKRSEWFVATPELVRFIAENAHPPPDLLARRRIDFSNNEFRSECEEAARAFESQIPALTCA
jgi:hypothetical protein